MTRYKRWINDKQDERVRTWTVSSRYADLLRANVELIKRFFEEPETKDTK